MINNLNFFYQRSDLLENIKILQKREWINF